MKKNQVKDLEEEFREDTETENTVSVDDFLLQLEAKEKDLDISPNLAIEIEDSDVESSQNFPVENLEQMATPQTSATNRPDPKDQRVKSELAALKNQVAELKAERVKLVERNKQTIKEFDNFKNRMDRERRETFVGQLSQLASSMLPVTDNLDRALDFVPGLEEEKSATFKQFFEGIVLVNQQIMEILNDMGVQLIPAVGEQFDPQFHEAVAVEPSEDLSPNSISEELVRGYRLGDKIIRHSMVKVVAEPPKTSEPEPAENATVEHSEDETQMEASETLPDLDEEVEELIASSYAQSTDSETN